MGIDFGTSCSKVVIGDPGWQDTCYAVPFGSSPNAIANWLHPTRLNGEANLKMRLMDDPASEMSRRLAARYLAEVIIHSRAWFANYAPSRYRQRDIRWRLNVGFPGKSVHGPLADSFREVACMAAALASQTPPVSPDTTSQLKDTLSSGGRFIQPSNVGLYPEIAAQLAGYVNSPFRRQGNLLLIDVGAGTLDVSTIILHGDSHQDIVSFHHCDVAPLGVLRRYQAASAALERVAAGCLRFPLHHFQDGSRAVPEHLREIVHHTSPALQQAFDRSSQNFARDILDVAHACLGRFRLSQRQHHNSASYDPWGSQLRFFLTGGGCRSPFYREQLANGPLENRLIQITRWHPDQAQRRAARQGLLLQRLPTPQNLENFPASLHPDFDRLSVAYGLAFGGENLMKVTAATPS